MFLSKSEFIITQSKILSVITDISIITYILKLYVFR